MKLVSEEETNEFRLRRNVLQVLNECTLTLCKVLSNQKATSQAYVVEGKTTQRTEHKNNFSTQQCVDKTFSSKELTLTTLSRQTQHTNSLSFLSILQSSISHPSTGMQVCLKTAQTFPTYSLIFSP